MQFVHDERSRALSAWLTQLDMLQHEADLVALPQDASTRRYFRVTHRHTTYIAMDAPPTLHNCRPFIAIANALYKLGLKTPEVIAENVAQGFLLLTDFGHQQLLEALTPENVSGFYALALDNLATLQNCRDVSEWSVPVFTENLMHEELIGFQDWFLSRHLQLNLAGQDVVQLQQNFHWLIAEIAKQPKVFMHRDYHSANLMVLDNQRLGILDFQDAFIGPLCYDAVSLLRDCYIAWPEDQVTAWAVSFWERIQARDDLRGVSAAQFLYWFDLMGIERHLKAILTFARKYHRDHDRRYLQHIPRTLQYLATVSERYPALSELHQALSTIILPAYHSRKLLVM